MNTTTLIKIILPSVIVSVIYICLHAPADTAKQHFFASTSEDSQHEILSVNINNKDHYLAIKSGAEYSLLFTPKHHMIHINDPVYTTGLDYVNEPDVLIGFIHSIEDDLNLPYQIVKISYEKE